MCSNTFDGGFVLNIWTFNTDGEIGACQRGQNQICSCNNARRFHQPTKTLTFHMYNTNDIWKCPIKSAQMFILRLGNSTSIEHQLADNMKRQVVTAKNSFQVPTSGGRVPNGETSNCELAPAKDKPCTRNSILSRRCQSKRGPLSTYLVLNKSHDQCEQEVSMPTGSECKEGQ